MNIIKELNTSKKERLDKAEGFVNDCKMLMEASQADERAILNKLGLDTHIKEAEKNIELQVLNKKYTDEYEGEIFHMQELNKIACKHRLYMRKSNQYLGTIPPDLAAIVLRLVKKGKIAISNSNDYNDFYVMAPPKMFKQYMGTKEVANYVVTETQKNYQSFIAKMQDPILFYKVDQNHFVMLKKWGNDFNIGRAIYAKIVKTRTRIVSLGFIVAAFLTALPFYGWTQIPVGTFTTKTKDYVDYNDQHILEYSNSPKEIFAFLLGCIHILYIIFTVIAFVQWFKYTKRADSVNNWFKSANY